MANIERFLSQCESEALHFSGKIQGHGALLLLAEQGCIRHVSSNAEALLALPIGQLLGQPLPPDLAHLTFELALTLGTRRVILAACRRREGYLDAVVTRGQAGQVVIELFPNPVADAELGEVMYLPIKDPVPEHAAALHQAEQTLTAWVSQESGCQRVMYYRFREEGDGEVIAETLSGGGYGSYLGLRYPASDIPQIARQLYLLNPWRQIPDRQAEAFPVQSCDGDVPDLSYADLRSVSPAHCEYLANMGVRASLSFPVVVNGELVALLAAHHDQPRVLSLLTLERIAQRVKRHAEALATYRLHWRMQLVDRINLQFSPLAPYLQGPDTLIHHWPEVASHLMRVLDCDGLMLMQAGGACLSFGEVLSLDEVAKVHQVFSQRRELLWMCDSLLRAVPDWQAGEIAGVVVLQLGGALGGWQYLYLTRLECIHEVAWGGEPR